MHDQLKSILYITQAGGFIHLVPYIQPIDQSSPLPTKTFNYLSIRDTQEGGKKGKAQPFHLERKLFMTSMENRKTKRPEEHRKNQIREESKEDK